MGRYKTNIDILFRDGLENYEVLPPGDVWEGVSGAVPMTKSALLRPAAAAIAFLIFISGAAISFMRLLENSGLAPELSASQPAYISSDPQLAFNDNINRSNIPEKRFPGSKRKRNEVIQKQVLAYHSSGQSEVLVADPLASNINSPAITDDNERKLVINRQSIIFPPVTGKADLKEKNTGKTNKWSVGAQLSPSFFLSNGNVGIDLSKSAMLQEDAMISYSGGVAFSYQINNRFSIQSGLSYSSVGHSIGGISVFSGFFRHAGTKSGPIFDVSTSNGTIVTSNRDIYLLDFAGDRVASSFTSETFDPYKADLQYLGNDLYQSFKYLEFPIILRYKVVDRKFDLNLLGGLAYNFLIGNDAFTFSEGSKVNLGTTDGLIPLTFSSSVGLGMEYSFSGKLILNIEPVFRYYVNPFGTISGDWQNPYSFGFSSGIFYKF